MTAGLQSRLSVTFDGSDGRTRSRVSTQAPLDLRGPLRSDAGHDLYYLRNNTSGIFGGDVYDIDVTATGCSDVQVASPSSTKVYSMTACAETRVCLEAGEGSRLVWGPHPLILQRDANYAQRTTVKLAGGVVILCEVLAMGRLARGESGQFRRFTSELEVWGSGCEPLYEERYVLLPDSDCLEDSLGGFGALASVYALGLSEQAQGEVVASLAGVGSGFAGASKLPNGAGVVGRALTGSLSASVAFCEAVRSSLQASIGATTPSR